MLNRVVCKVTARLLKVKDLSDVVPLPTTSLTSHCATCVFLIPYLCIISAKYSVKLTSTLETPFYFHVIQAELSSQYLTYPHMHYISVPCVRILIFISLKYNCSSNDLQRADHSLTNEKPSNVLVRHAASPTSKSSLKEIISALSEPTHTCQCPRGYLRNIIKQLHTEDG
jgi:hypothetical protein